MKVVVIGCGYLGATHAACMAELGFDVLGVDVDAARAAVLSSGNLPFFEPGLESLLRKHVESGRLQFSTSFAEAARFADLHFLCVGTPQSADGNAADLRQVSAAVESLGPHLTGRATIVGKSTVPVGTAKLLATRISQLAQRADTVELVWNPEFLREGFAVQDTLTPDRLVFGVQSDQGEQTLRTVYASMIADGVPVIVTDLATAELVKVAANAFLATKISFINAMAEICEVSGADVGHLADAIGKDARIGRQFLNAGLGFGGGCLPKDIRAFMHRAGELGVPESLAFLREVDAVNHRRRQHVVDLTRGLLRGGLIGATVAILGAAFKPNSDDIRDSPALWVAGQLSLAGADVRVYDPVAMESARHQFPTLSYADSVHQACAGADIVLHLTEWTEFREIDPAQLARAVNHRIMIDGRNCLNADKWRSSGWDYRSLGRA